MSHRGNSGDNRGSFTSPRFRRFSPSTERSGEQILNNLKDKWDKEREMFFSTNPEWTHGSNLREADDGDDWMRRRMDDARGRADMFRMPTWMPEDSDAMSDLASRMSNTPHFATFGRRVGGRPFRERKSSGGSAMSATSEDDSLDTTGMDKSSQCSSSDSEVHEVHEIPIAIEAEAPESMRPQAPPAQDVEEQEARVGQVRKCPQFATCLSSDVNGGDVQKNISRSTRCSSAPPGNATQPKYVTRVTMGPPCSSASNQVPVKSATFSGTSGVTPTNASSKINSIPKPWVPFNRQEESHLPHIQEQENSPYASQDQVDSGGVRSIPIFIESKARPTTNGSASPPKTGSSWTAKQQIPINTANKWPQQQRVPQNTTRSEPVVPEEEVRPAPLPVPPKGPLDIIEEVRSTVREYGVQAKQFQGTRKDREYLVLDEMLTRCLLKLDDIDPDGNDDVRQARREAIREINSILTALEMKSKEREQEAVHVIEHDEISDQQFVQNDSTNQGVENTNVNTTGSMEQDSTTPEQDSTNMEIEPASLPIGNAIET